MPDELTCPGCRLQLDPISAQGRADDLYVCNHCYHSWFAFELDVTNTNIDTDDGEPPSMT